MARELSEAEPPGTDESPAWIEAESQVNEAIVAVRPFCPAPVERAVDKKTDKTTPDCYVTMSQMAAIVNRNKKTIQRLYDAGKLPSPTIESDKGKGKPHEWLWREVRKHLENEYSRQLPEVFPADQFVRF